MTDAADRSGVERGEMRISLHGPGATIEHAIQSGEAMKRLLAAVAADKGLPEVQWEIARIEFQCDGCGLKRPDRPRAEEGWTYSEGDDLCPACTARRSA